MNLLYLIPGLLIALGLVSFLPAPRASGVRSRQLRLTFGFKDAQERASKLGINFKVGQYIVLICISVVVGALIAYITNNIFFIVVGISAAFFMPQIFISTLEHRRRREIIANLPVNLRLLVSKFREAGSLQRSLELSMDVMHGVTKPYFYRLYGSLELGIPPEIALDGLRKEIRYRRFNDVCDKILSGMRDGFHKRSVDVIRQSIKDMQSDTQLLNSLDINNRSKIMTMYIIVLTSWLFPILFTYLESQSVTGQVPTVQTLFGKIMLASMAVTSLLTLLGKNKYLQLNFQNLE